MIIPAEIYKSLAKKIDKDIVIYDLESTGIDTSVAEIVQFSATKLGKDGTISKLEFLCKPRKPIPKEASDIHGITNEKVTKCKDFGFYAKRVVEFMKNSTVAGFNIVSYDTPLLTRQLKDFGIEFNIPSSEMMDVYQVYKKHHRRRLSDAVEFYMKEQMLDAHNANSDVFYTICCLNAQLDLENKTPSEISKEIPASREDRFIKFNDKKEPIINFGKNAGKRVADVDKGFLQWIMGKDFPQSVKTAIKPFLK